ncbi:TPA: DUF1090 domain-containing protein [Raoultella planticola]|nr:DUF1090 domain-containing protein [Raoultella planticola]
MKLCHSLIFTVPFFVFSSLSFAAQNCAIKEREIRTQLDYAIRYGNVYRIEGLERALANIQTYCYNGYNHPTERYYPEFNYQYDIARKEQRVAKRKEKLYKAKLKGKPSKIAKEERKLAEAEFELKQARELAKLEK